MARKSTERPSAEAAPNRPVIKRALWTPQPGPQCNAITADWCPILFYGGGKYSGKSDFLLGDYLQDIETYREHWQGIVFRRALTEFTELKLRAAELFPQIGGIWHQQTSEWRFPKYKKGELMPILRFRYLEDLRDIRLYEGHSYPWIGIDELGDWEDPAAFFRLLTLNRYGRHPIPNKRVRATGNPGGRGHQWIREYFVDPAPLGSKLLYDETLKMNYMFILGTYRDNKIGMMNDPGYADRMNRAGSPALVRALKEGDFSVVAGAFFDFLPSTVIHPFPIPPTWMKYMSMDWGSCGEGDPFSIGWWAVSDGTDNNGTIPYLRRGTKIRYREWWGRGLPRVTVAEVAKGIKEREQSGEEIFYRVAGGDIKKKMDGSGPSILEMFADFDIYFRRADMNRAPGWLQMRAELRGVDNVPMVRIFSTCHDSIKIIPAVQHSIKDANDIEPFNDDIPDEWRYGLMSRPFVKDVPEVMTAEKATVVWKHQKQPSINDLWEQAESDSKRYNRD